MHRDGWDDSIMPNGGPGALYVETFLERAPAMVAALREARVRVAIFNAATPDWTWQVRCHDEDAPPLDPTPFFQGMQAGLDALAASLDARERPLFVGYAPARAARPARLGRPTCGSGTRRRTSRALSTRPR